MKEKQKPSPGLERDCDEAPTETLAAPRDGAAPAQAAGARPRPSHRGPACGSHGPRRLARLHADEDDNEDNNDDE